MQKIDPTFVQQDCVKLLNDLTQDMNNLSRGAPLDDLHTLSSLYRVRQMLKACKFGIKTEIKGVQRNMIQIHAFFFKERGLFQVE